MRFKFLGLGFVLTMMCAVVGAQNTQNPFDALKDMSQGQTQDLLNTLTGTSNGESQKADEKLMNPETVAPKSREVNEDIVKEPLYQTHDERTLRLHDEDPELRANDTILIDLTPYEVVSRGYGNGPNGPNGANGTSSNGQSPLSPTGLQNPAAGAALALGQTGSAPASAGAAGSGLAGISGFGPLGSTNGSTTGLGGVNATDQTDYSPSDFGRIQTTVTQKTDEEEDSIEKFRERILDGNPFTLNRRGVLEIPRMPPIPLAGLTAREASRRLSADPQFRDYQVKVTLLRLQPLDEQALKPFGYDLFQGVPSTFAPVKDIQVPPDYAIGPGDTFSIVLYGSDPATYKLVVGRDGRLNFPKLGPIEVGGLSFDAARQAIERRVGEQLIGTHVSVTMGDLRDIRVFVLGEAEKPGSYSVGGLSTMTNALFASGGIKTIGSLRNIQLKRDGQLVSTLDLYDLLLHGDTSGDRQLKQGDVIFIPPVGATVSIYGAVRRPAIYELKNEKTAGQLIGMAGGLLPDADAKTAQIERILQSDQHEMVNVDLLSNRGLDARLDDGDKLRVPIIRPTLENSVELTGFVFRPGAFEYRAGLRLTDVLGSFDELRPGADRHYIMIRREVPPEERVEVISADLERALTARHSAADPELHARDKIFVFDLSADRARVVKPVLDALELQSGPDHPAQVVTVDGQVKAPGKYPLDQPTMHVSDLIRAGGSLEDSAYTQDAELTRYAIVNGQKRQTESFSVDLSAIRHGVAGADLALQPYDTLVVKITPQWKQPGTIELAGEFRFPGKYPIHTGETLRSVLERAGGFTDVAFPYGTVFIREELKKREKDQLDLLTNRLQTDLASLSLSALATSAATNSGGGAQSSGEAMMIGQQLIQELRDTKPVGRLVIDVDEVMKGRPGGPGDVLLRDGDKLLVPKQTQEITILGEVQSPTSHVYRPGLSRDDYIDMSGGATRKADVRHIYVVRANGDVVVANRGGWFRRSHNIEMLPGDTIVVPLNTERVRALPLWSSVTTIIYNLAIALLAIHSVQP